VGEAERCSVAVAKLDRLSREVHFIAGLVAHRVPFLAAELGTDVVPFILHLLATLAQKERTMIGTRLRVLRRLRRRGVILGNPNGARAAGQAGGQ
jgi:DNA invertase Pin-like site-specific DNA recombinase